MRRIMVNKILFNHHVNHNNDDKFTQKFSFYDSLISR
jgi:hypothetical protein